MCVTPFDSAPDSTSVGRSSEGRTSRVRSTMRSGDVWLDAVRGGELEVIR